MDLLVNIDVDDLPRAIDFYTQAFDLRIGRRFGESGVELLGTSAPIYLLVKAAGTSPFARASHGRDYGRHWTSVHLDFVVPNIDAAVARAVAAGGEVGAAHQGEQLGASWRCWLIRLATAFAWSNLWGGDMTRLRRLESAKRASERTLFV